MMNARPVSLLPRSGGGGVPVPRPGVLSAAPLPSLWEKAGVWESGITFTDCLRAEKMVTHSLINVVHGFWDMCLPLSGLRSERISL